MSAARFSWLALALLAACDGNPLAGTPTEEVPVDSSGVPTEVSKDMNAMSFTNGVLKIDMQGVTSSGQMATFVRMKALDVPSGTGNPGYAAYAYQETGMNRSYLAYVAENDRGNLLAVSASDGGQFNEHNAGGQFVRLTAYTKPTIGQGPDQGLFSYAGSYVGIFAPGEFTDSSASLPGELRPAEPFIVKGTALINGDFAHGMVEGGVTDRTLYDQNGNQITGITIDDGDPSTSDTAIDTTNLLGIVLRETTIDSNGQFLGNVEFYGAPGADVGDYAGAFGGLQASDVAGVLWLNPIKGHSDIWEYGTFNLPRCDMAGNSPICIPAP